MAGLLAATAGCDLGAEGLVFLADDRYRPSVMLTSEAGFSSPDGIAWHGDTLYLADEAGRSVEAWSRHRGLRRLCDSRLGIISPEDLVVDGDGSVYFTDDSAGGLWKIDTAGRSSRVAGPDAGLVSTEGIALAPDGTILVGDGKRHRVFAVTREGAVSVYLGPESGIRKPESLAFDEHGDLFVGDNEDDVLYRVAPDRTIGRVSSGRGRPLSPESLFYSGGTLYITDSRAGEVLRFDLEGGLRTIARLTGKLANVQGIAASAEGDVYVTVQDLGRRRGYLLKFARRRG
jgi:sugar lactone lactonase YvrE